MQDLTIITEHEAGIARFDNYEEIKAFLENQLESYKNIVYIEENIKEAKEDKKSLSKLKKALDEKRKEIKKAYMAPYLELKEKIKELIALIDEPLGLISEFINNYDDKEKEAKKTEIKRYYDSVSSCLGDYAESVFGSESFFEKSWLNKSTPVKAWQDEIKEKITACRSDIESIKATGGSNTNALMSVYLETMTLSTVIDFQKKIQDVSKLDDTDVHTDSDEDNIAGYKILKISGTNRQMAQLIDQLELMNMEYEEIEDGMPKDFEEVLTPDFDSFVAFDIETSGTYGAAYGDAPAEITEIGAVKVVNGVIVERFDELCNPGRKITSRIEKITHITNEMVQDKPSVSEIIKKFSEFVGDMILVGHNIKSSDLHYISTACKRAGISMGNKYFDTYLFAKHFKKEQNWECLKLEYLSEQFGIEQSNAHRAWCDAETNVGVYFNLIKITKETTN